VARALHTGLTYKEFHAHLPECLARYKPDSRLAGRLAPKAGCCCNERMETAIVRTIQAQGWLDPIADTLQQGVASVFDGEGGLGKSVENALHGDDWLGHPLHPALTDIPVGAWTVALVLDLIEETGATKYQAGADAAVATGLIGATAAAVTGLTDWKDVQGPPRRTGLLHAMLNTLAAGLYVTSYVKRKGQNRESARGLAYAAYGVVLASAWLGGHLVFRDQIGPAS
jgi:uncharacterized membrane protein